MADDGRERFWGAVHEMEEKDAMAARANGVYARIQAARDPWAVYYKEVAEYANGVRPPSAAFAEVQERLWDAATLRDQELIQCDQAVRRLVRVG